MPMPDYDQVVFAKPPLRVVLAQIRFPTLFRFQERPFLAPFHDAIREAYPRVELERQVGVKVSPQGAESATESVWRFTDSGGTWSILLGEDALTLECRKYESFQPFLERLRVTLTAAAQQLGIAQRVRVGLRFVNELRAEGAKDLATWGGLLNPSFVGFGSSDDGIGGTVEHAYQELQFKREDGILVVRHGLLQGTTVAPPGSQPPPGGPFYLLDLDYFDPSVVSLDIQSTCDQLENFHGAMYRFFRWSMDGGSMYDRLEPLP